MTLINVLSIFLPQEKNTPQNQNKKPHKNSHKNKTKTNQVFKKTTQNHQTKQKNNPKHPPFPPNSNLYSFCGTPTQK